MRISDWSSDVCSSDLWRRAGERVGVVPTMGALHAGHLALIAAAKADCARVIATLFVNPKQFNRSDDLASYPRDESGDAAKLAAAGVDVLFAPPVEAVYPAGFERSEEHTSELQSLMRISYAVFCLKKQNNTHRSQQTHTDGK